MNGKSMLKVIGLFLFLTTWTTMVAQVQSGADSYVYSPQYGNFDNFNAKGDLQFQITAGALSKSVLPGIRLSYSPLDHVGVGVSYFSFSNSSSQFDPQQTKGQIISGDVFYYSLLMDSEKVRLRGRLGAGYGFGEVFREYGDDFSSNATLGIQRYVVEAGALVTGKNVGLGIGLRGKYYNFSNEIGVGELSFREVEKLNYLIEVAPAFLIDLNLRFEFGGELGRLFLTLDTTMNNFKNERNIISSLIDRDSIHIGYYFMISKAINKKK